MAIAALGFEPRRRTDDPEVTLERHRIEIPQDVIDRAIMRRGTRHVFERIDPARTALLVIDLQRAYVADATAVPSARGIVDNVNRLANSLRKAGGRVVWIKDTRDENSPTARWPRFVEFCASEWGEELTRALSPSHPGHELYDGLAVDPADDVVLKTRFSALIQGSSDLHERLMGLGIDTVIVTGTVTNVCCESTARDAMMLNYKVHFVADGTAARTDAEHNATLANMLLWFADVRTTDEVVALIDDAAQNRQEAVHAAKRKSA
jgi:ureidoacrylate peracid hydrolase